MKKIALAMLVAAGLIATAGTAQAKEVISLKICGASGCQTSTDPDQLGQWEPEAGVSPDSVSFTNPQPYYTMELGFGEPGGNMIHREAAYWLRDSNLMRFQGDLQDSWSKLIPSQVSLYQKVAAGVEPFTPQLSRVTVAGKRVADPSSYLRLMGNFRSTLYPNGKLHLTRIVLRTSETNPWVDGVASLSYDAKRRLLIRSDGYFKLPSALGKLVMRRASLSTKTSSSGSGGGDTALYAGVGVGVLAGLGALAVLGRKRIN